MNPRFPNVWIYDHPLIQHKLTIMRDKRTEHEQFRQLLNQITGLMAYDVCRNLPVRDLDVETPITRTSGSELASTTTIVPILRAGLAMMDGLLALFPEAHVGHVGQQVRRPRGVGHGPGDLGVDDRSAVAGVHLHQSGAMENAVHRLDPEARVFQQFPQFGGVEFAGVERVDRGVAAGGEGDPVRRGHQQPTAGPEQP
jgi:hypothetical protein